MEEVIKMIIQIEDKAQKIIDDAVADKKFKESEHKERIKLLEDTIVNDAKHKVDQIREREFMEIKGQEIVKIFACERHLEQMEIEAKAKMDIWVDELVKRVLS